MIPYFFMPCPEVSRATGFGKSKIYDCLNPESGGYDPDFPKPVVISKRCVRWRSDEVQAWLDKKSSDRNSGHAEREEQARKAGKVGAAKRRASAVELAGQA